jgi:8-oxo-dGTP pyrophosphatase MutT (NUDIX family)
LRFDEVVTCLEAAMRGPLPGAAAHALMAPRPRHDWPPGFPAQHIRRAAGLLLVMPIDDQPHIVLTVRAHTLDRHGGQVSLPGGVIEPGETFEQAAFREAREEIALDVDRVRSLGALTPIDIPVSGFRLHPVVAVAEQRPNLRPADGEVAEIVEPSIASLMDPDRVAWRTMTRDGRSLDFPAFLAGPLEIWGATAMVIAEFLALLGWKGSLRDDA